MLTSYLVSCPYSCCHWSGCLLPHEHLEAWRGAAPNCTDAVFLCPQCQREWHARIAGDDVVPVPLDLAVAGVLTP
jgi:hypothetical protein